MLRKIRITLAALFLVGTTLLFLDFTGTVHAYLGWMARVQLLPALLALNVAVVAVLVVLTLLLGRVYCSVVCPLGVMQDVISWLSGRIQGKTLRFGHSPARNVLRYAVLVAFVACMVAGVGSGVALLAPYSAYGRIAQNLLQPLYLVGNNALAALAERMDSYAFYGVEVWVRGGATFAVALLTFVVLGVLAWRGGRTYCNTICPVGTLLGTLSRWAWLRPVIDTDKCNGCGRCARMCKASCIDSKAHTVDMSRCVACMDCIASCRQGAIRYAHKPQGQKPSSPQPASSPKGSAPAQEGPDMTRRTVLTSAALLAAGVAAKAEEKTVDGGLAVLLDRQLPQRQTPIAPAGAKSVRHFAQHCTGCQLCVSQCPEGVLQPSAGLTTLMQPTMQYDHGYCRPECTRCADVCPTGAIRPLTTALKSSTQIGHAVWVRKNCVVLTDEVSCGNCARHCPTGAITMIPSVAGDEHSPKIPSVNIEKCIGCGACEHLCPARPFSAIYVEGHEVHRTI